MREVCGKPLLGHLLDRLERCRTLDGIVVATSVQPENDVIEAYCNDRAMPCFRGSEDDVLGRLLGALQSQDAAVGVEVYGDGPLADPEIIDYVVDWFLARQGELEFVGNDLETSYPPGTEVEVFSIDALADADGRTDDPEIREHGTLYLRTHPDRYRITNLIAPEHLRFPDLSLEVDTPEDFQVVTAILEHFGDRADYSTREVIDFLIANQSIARINQSVPRRWKAFRKATGNSN